MRCVFVLSFLNLSTQMSLQDKICQQKTKRVVPSDDGAEAVVATTIDVISGVEDDIGLLRTLVFI